MFIVHFNGGLGNQIFQYAFLRRLQIEHPDTAVFADLTDYRQHTFHHGYELERVFGIKVTEATDEDIERLSGKNVFDSRWRQRWKRFKRVFKRTQIVPESFFSSVGRAFSDIQIFLARIRDTQDVYFDGYWQRPEFYDLSSDALKRELVFRYKVTSELQYMLNDIAETNSVAVHIRRGDYVGSDFDIVGLDYYERAINYMNSNLTEPKFFFFSDDVNYIINNFAAVKNKVIVDINHGDRAYLDMMLMTKCRHNIVAYSTFSYWGAHLNEKKDKIVIAPQVGIVNDNQLLMDKDWLLL